MSNLDQITHPMSNPEQLESAIDFEQNINTALADFRVFMDGKALAVASEPPYSVDLGPDADPMYLDNPTFYRAAADTVEQMYEKYPKLETDSRFCHLRLLTLAPIFAFSQSDLTLRRNQMSRGEIVAAKQYASRFNDALRNVVSLDPTIPQSALKNALASHMHSEVSPRYSGVINNHTGRREHITLTHEQIVQTAVNGAAQEIAFEQICDYLGVPYERGDMDDDLKGRDYTVFGQKVDIKRSLTDFKHKDRQVETRHQYGDKKVLVCPLIPIDVFEGSRGHETFIHKKSALESRYSAYQQLFEDIANA